MYVQNKSEPGFCSHWSYQLNLGNHRILKWFSYTSILKAFTWNCICWCRVSDAGWSFILRILRHVAVLPHLCGHLLSPLCSQPSQAALQVNLYLISTTRRTGRTKGQTQCLEAEPVLLQHGLF